MKKKIIASIIILIIITVISLPYFHSLNQNSAPSPQDKDIVEQVNVQDIVENKGPCIQGEESVPRLYKQQYVVDVFDYNCQIIQTKICPQEFVRIKDSWACQ